MFQHRFQPHKSPQLVFNSQSLSLSLPFSLFHSLSLPLSLTLSVETCCSSTANREICVLCLCRIGLEERREQTEGEREGERRGGKQIERGIK